MNMDGKWQVVADSPAGKQEAEFQLVGELKPGIFPKQPVSASRIEAGSAA